MIRKFVFWLLVTVVVVVGLTGAVVGIAALSYSFDMHIDSAQGIKEAGYVRIGGIDQWIQIRGQDRNNPVLLWLNGGPGFSTVSNTYDYRSWERDFTIVMWDQRGEGKTFERSGTSVKGTMTIAQFTEDCIEVAQYLRHHLRKDKIILLGHSWGSMLGVHVVHARPDLFSVYVGTGQLVNEQQNAQASYPLLLARARSLGNRLAEQQLLVAGPPPYPDDVLKWIPWATWAQILDSTPAERSLLTAGRLWLAIQSFFKPHDIAPGITPAVQFSMSSLWPDIVRDDLPSLGLQFDVPVVFIQGTDDITTVTALAKDYFDQIDAPSKRFISLEGAGHLAIFGAREKFLKALIGNARPLAISANGS